ncbi:hypothetical protein BBO99_00009019 [Phytophthora kernoviae]|uniref:Cas12f1-like TNB domain-containing protein n=2 Tax=Phytophthora kernoviae TaxID=325452 RepID=A0A3R7K2D6_9STRA|nr:hypothetical protein G195_011689 [Phytophthora kernoviae 00238/432]RLN06166.1 hypothetical protein BBI17_009400 [Phytophthora kernoviae]RLN74263.1 hypothetical protein BBO99_00009019 [Phytophthora kernoviae]
MVCKHFEEVTSDATPKTASDEMRAAVLKRKIRGPTARAMMAQTHYRFKMLLKYKTVRSSDGVIDCEEEYTSKTCSRCGAINHKLGEVAVVAIDLPDAVFVCVPTELIGILVGNAKVLGS